MDGAERNPSEKRIGCSCKELYRRLSGVAPTPAKQKAPLNSYVREISALYICGGRNHDNKRISQIRNLDLSPIVPNLIHLVTSSS